MTTTTTRTSMMNILLISFLFSPLISLHLLLIATSSSISSAFTTTSTTLSLSGSSRNFIENKIIVSSLCKRLWHQSQFQLRKRQIQDDDSRQLSLSSKPSLTALNMLSSSSSSDNERQETTLDVSSYMFPTTSTIDDETKDYIMQQTMIRVKDPIQSLDFYCKILGFRLIHYSEVR